MKHKFKLTRLWVASLLLLFGFTTNAWAWENKFYEVYMAFSFNGDNKNYTYYKGDNNSSQSWDLGTLTGDFKITAYYAKWECNDNKEATWSQLCYTTGGTTQYHKSLTWNWMNNCQFEISNTTEKQIASYTNPSGNYTFTHWWQGWRTDWGDQWINNNGKNYKFTYTILPPAIKDNTYKVSITGDDVKAGTGTEVDPYIIKNGGQMHVSISATQKHTDANSSLNLVVYKDSKDIDAKGYSLDLPNITNTTAAHMYVKGYYKNGDLKGAQKEEAIYYKAETLYTVSVGKTTGGTVSPEGDQSVGAYTSKTLTATNNTGYHFVNWTTTGGAILSTTSETSTTLTASATGTVTANFAPNTNTAYTVKHYKQNLEGTYPSEPFATDNLTGTTGASVTPAVKTGDAITGFTAPSTQTTNILADGSLIVNYYYTRNTHKFAWDWAGGSTSSENYTAANNAMKYGATITYPAGNTMSRSGYNFTGWSSSETTMPDADLTITAQWEKAASFKVTYEAPDKTSGDVPTDATEYTLDAQVTVRGAGSLARTGYDFAGWKNSVDNITYTAGQTFVISSNTTLTAQWNVHTYTITYNGLEGGTHSNPTTYTIETTTFALADASRDNYTFDGWFDAATDGNKVTEITNGSYGDKTLWARWHETTYLISASEGTGIQSIDPVSQQVGNVTEKTFTATLKTGYTWANWTLPAGVTGTATNNPISVKATADGTITANATETPYTITLVSADENKGTVNGPAVTAKVVTTTTITATPKSGYIFDKWEASNANIHIANANAASTTITATEAGTVTASFKLRYALHGSYKDSDEGGGMPGWSAAGNMTVSGSIVSIACDLHRDVDYKFKIMDLQTGQYYCAENDKSTMTSTDCTNWHLVSDKTWIVGLYATIAGTYTFNYDYNTQKISVIYPQGYFLHGEWNNYDGNEQFVFNGDAGTVSVNLAEINHKYGFKVVANGVFYRDENQSTMTEGACTDWKLQQGSENFYIQTTVAGNYTFNLDKNLMKLSVIYPGETKTDVTVYLDGETASTVQVGEATHPTIVAVQYVNGKRFAGWQADEGVTLANANDRTTQITAVTGTGKSVRATYNSDYMVYFKNTPGWDNVYVFFYKQEYYDSKTGTGAWCKDSEGKLTIKVAEGYTMTRLNNKSDIWYYDYSALSETYKTRTIAFNDHFETNNEWFDACQAAYRTDWDRTNNLSVFVPEKNITEKKNNDRTAYYNKGYWMKYDDLKTGYYLRVKGLTESGTEYEFKAASAGEPYKATITLEGSQTKEFWINGVNGSAYKNAGTMTSSGSHSGWEFYEGNQDNCKITTTSEGTYTFTLTFGEGMLLVSVEYPLSENDYRVVYTDNSHPCHPSTFIRKGNGNKDTVSFFIDKGKNPALKFQYCSNIEGSTVTWADVANGTIDISGITATGIYNFNLVQTASAISCTSHELYDGDFYIRTAIAAGGWDAYKGSDDNLLPYIEYGLDESQKFKFTHAYTNWVEKDKNVKFCIANDYSLCISDTLVGDDIIGHEVNADWLKNGANIRFMWNKNTNDLKRAYISGSTNDAEKFLMLENTNHKMYDKAGNEQKVELKFDDKNNWVYQADIQAQPGCAVRLTAQYTIGTTAYKQYFIGSETESKEIISGTGDKKYKMRVVYDFKTNRLTAGWVPDGTQIDEPISLGGDMLLVREHQGKASQITFGETGSVSDIHHIYSVLTIKKDTMLGKANTEYTTAATNTDYKRTMYWISFPFDVKISEVFGVDGYGKKWIMQRYNGEKRAEIGWFQETETFWEYLAPTSTLQAYKGYLLILNANYFNTDGADVWKNSATEANFYFPSAEKNIGIINKSSVDVPVPAHVCGIDRPFADDSKKNHKITDSYWNVIGVPAFQDAPAEAAPVNDDFKSYYEWVPATNTYKAKVTMDGVTFKTMHAYMVQFGGKLTWKDVSVVSNPAPAPYAYADAKNYRIELFFNGNGAEDHTYINLADEAHTDFVLNEDMMKIDNAGFPNIYSFAGAYDVAYNETTFDNQTVMLGVSAPKDGSYTFAMPKDFSGKAVLVDLETGEATDLNLSDYTVELEKGTYNNRFQLLLEVEAKAPTAIDNAKGEWSVDGKTKKLFINDNIYLINAGRIYNASGTKVR